MRIAQRMTAFGGVVLAAATFLAASAVGFTTNVTTAQAVPSSVEYQRKVDSHNALKKQLAGVNAELAKQIEDLNDLTENQIPAAQAAADEASQAAQQAQSLADATGQRLDAARKDKADLEAKIEATGEDYDDAKDAVAQMARQSFHTSDTSQMMSVITNSTSTKDFVDKLQADAAVARIEANAASDAAVELNTSMNRKERMAAIEDEIADLKAKADAQAKQAAAAAATAKAKQDELDALREQGNAKRAELEGQVAGLESKEAKEAAEIVLMKSQIDAYNLQLQQQQQQQQQQQKPGVNTGGQITQPSQPSTPSNPSTPSTPSGGTSSGSGGASGMNYAVPGSCPEGSGFCYGHNTGNTVGSIGYPERQCTLWAYIRRSQLSLPVGSYMGNGQDWGNTGRALGYLVNTTPHVGAAMVFRAGQKVTYWYANARYGHVAIVERVNADGSVLISEGGTGFASFPTWETIPNAASGNYTYVHY